MYGKSTAGPFTRTAQAWESTFVVWAQSPGKTEQQRCDNAVGSIRNAVARNAALQQRQILVFTQGSYRNRVNVRQDSDVDVGVMLHDYFLAQYPSGKSNSDYGNSSAPYSFAQFKNELEQALVDHFGRAAVTRGNKAFDIKANSYHVEADVVPVFEFRHYVERGGYVAGVALVPDRGGRIENFPERLLPCWPEIPLHYENGVAKNSQTSRRFKGVVRILKKLRNEMDDGGDASAKAVPGYLLESMAWNAPDVAFTRDSWDERIQAVLLFLWSNTKDDQSCEKWTEVDGLKWLFRPLQPWTRAEAHAFIWEAWKYIGIRRL